MSLDFLSFLANPYFVLAWYGFGLLAAGWMLNDMRYNNVNLNAPLKAAFPILTVFFSVIMFVIYQRAVRPPLIECKRGEENKQAFEDYVKPMWKKVVGSVTHCVGGDGLGIMTAMVLSRLLNFDFWTEFWFEYAVGFGFGWFIFQYWAMRRMGASPLQALWRGGRAEFFSMITVMVGMGLVMRFVTPNVVGARPDPTSAAFWGFGALGLLVGAIFTYPMNWWLVSIGWKHGMG